MTASRPFSPVLLLGAGSGEATCGILYLASYLRRGGIEAFVRLYDGDETEGEIQSSLEALLARVRPKLVGISLKWFHHVHRALAMARVVRKIDPEIRVVVGGNTASYYWRELHAFDTIDHVVLGDGERPLLELCQGVSAPSNCVTRNASGASTRLPLTYVQGAKNTEDLHYSHFQDIFLSEMDAHSFSGWVAPGKGCAENCLYCGGARGNQKAAFGRAKPFLRSEESVRRDHQEIAGRTWQMRYDFSGSSAEFLSSTWAGVDLSHHCCTYFLWGVARVELIEALANTFERVFMVLDIGCFSEQQRLEQMKRGLLKPCATDAQLLELIAACRRHPNLEIEVSGIGGLPFATQKTLEEELALVKRVIDLDCVIGYQRLEAQPGALVTEHPARFEMVTEAKSFREFLDYFEARAPGDASVPMIRFADAKLEASVQRNSDAVDALNWDHRAAKRQVPLHGRSKLRNSAPSAKELTVGSWLGTHRVPARFRQEKVTVVRSLDGTQIHLAPSLDPHKFSDPALVQGEDAEILLTALTSFAEPATIEKSSAQLKTKFGMSPPESLEVIEHLVDGRFLEKA